MRRMRVLAVVAGILATSVAIGIAATASSSQPGRLTAVSLRTMSQVPLIKALVQRLQFAQSPTGGSSTTATVQTDKLAYLPGSPVVATGSGWLSGGVVTLTYTELSSTDTDPKAQLSGPATAYAYPGSDGTFTSAGNPNGAFSTDTVHNSTVTMNVTATGLDATGNTVGLLENALYGGVPPETVSAERMPE